MPGPDSFKDRAILWKVGKQMEAFGKPSVTLRIAQTFHCWLFFLRPHVDKAQDPAILAVEETERILGGGSLGSGVHFL